LHVKGTLISSQGLSESITVQVEIYVEDLGQQTAWLPAILGRVLNLEVVALGPGQLLQIKV